MQRVTQLRRIAISMPTSDYRFDERTDTIIRSLSEKRIPINPVVSALLVFVLSDSTRQYLTEKDPMALNQALLSLEDLIEIEA